MSRPHSLPEAKCFPSNPQSNRSTSRTVTKLTSNSRYQPKQTVVLILDVFLVGCLVQGLILQLISTIEK